MQSPRVASDPFALMLDPQSVLQAMESSERLRLLHSRICRPLDRMPPGQAATPAMSGLDPVVADEADDADDADDAAFEH